MRDDDDRPAMAAQVLLQPLQRCEVEVVGGFVEQHQLRRGREHAGQAQPGLLTAGQRPQQPVVADPGEAEPVQRGLDAGVGGVAVAGLERLHEIGVAGQHVVEVATGGGQLRLDGAQLCLDRPQLVQRVVDRGADGVAGREIGDLRQVPDTARDVHGDRAAVGGVEPGEQAQQRRLAGAVLADDADAFAGHDGLAHAVEDAAHAEGSGDVVEDDGEGGCRKKGGHSGSTSREGRKGSPRAGAERSREGIRGTAAVRSRHPR